MQRLGWRRGRKKGLHGWKSVLHGWKSPLHGAKSGFAGGKGAWGTQWGNALHRAPGKTGKSGRYGRFFMGFGRGWGEVFPKGRVAPSPALPESCGCRPGFVQDFRELRRGVCGSALGRAASVPPSLPRPARAWKCRAPAFQVSGVLGCSALSGVSSAFLRRGAFFPDSSARAARLRSIFLRYS